ncbi:hypothetical protein HY570_04110, partial [Candidatus Micrarchaeota archaeon]|nr:hypothetical protein [Candidatus Micrarchaeota archaeon]
LGPSSGLSNRIDYNREYFEHFLAPYLLPRLGGKFNLFNLTTRENSENIKEITGSLDAILGQAVRNRDRLLGKNKFAIAKLEEHAVRYCKYLSIEDPKTVQKVRTVFKWIQDYVSSNPKFDPTVSKPDDYQKKEFAKFASELLKVLENTFGKPEKIDVPNGYAYLDLHSLS